MPNNPLTIGCLASLALASTSAQALIVAGANGGANTSNHTTRSQLETALGLSFPIYDNVISFVSPGDTTSGIYLGHNAATSDVWVLSARHIGFSASYGSTVTIDGLAYDRQADGDGLGFLVGGDLRLIRYRRTDLAVPSLPAIKLATAIPAGGDSVVMIGFGRNRVENASINPATSDAVSLGVGTGYTWANTHIKRWATNNVENEFPDGSEIPAPVTGPLGTFSLGPYNTIGFATDFDQPGPSQWLTSNEGQGANGDSGGGTFFYTGSEWQLTGIFTAIATLSGQVGSSAGFGNLTFTTNISSYSQGIATALNGAVLVPEPSSLGLGLVSSILLLGRRRRLQK